MNDIEKIRVMLPHWIEHNRGHGAEFSQWAETLQGTDGTLAALLQQAVISLGDAQKALEEALQKAGGPMDDIEGHTHHHHHHH